MEVEGSPPSLCAFLFTDIEGSSRLWEAQPAAMQLAAASHDRILRAAIESCSGTVVKMLGDGAHAAFADPLHAIRAAVALQIALSDSTATAGIRLHVRCGVHLGDAQLRDGDYYGDAVNRAARIAAAAHGGQILASGAARSQADTASGEFDFRDLGRVRLKDLASPVQIFQVLHPGLRQDFPALRSLEEIPNNLPVQLTSFVGRDEDQRSLGNLLSSARLLTVFGAGGLGKTRLALQAAADALEAFPDGVWLVDLSPVVDPALVVHSIASCLGLREEAERSVEESLVAHLAERRLLLILDTCEHVLDECGAIVDRILRSSVGTKVLATSRELLRVPGEVFYRLNPLTLPDLEATHSLAELPGFGAIRLFCERGQAVEPGFRLTESNKAAVVEVCRRLDGIPLAIELAASCLRHMALQQIAERLADRFRLLSDGARTARPRQQTLHALMTWSHELLTDRERVLYRRLAVFPAGFRLESAEAVAGIDPIDPSDVVPLLGGLIDKSIVLLEGSVGRYRMLDTIRHFGLGRLAQTPEASDVRARFVSFHVDLAERGERNLFGDDQAFWIGRLTEELDNVIVAFDLCTEAAIGPRMGLRLALAMRPYWMLAGLCRLGFDLSKAVLQRVSVDDDADVLAGALVATAQLAHAAGDDTSAESFAQRGLELSRRIGTRSAPLALATLGEVCKSRRDIPGARAHLQHAVAIARDSGSGLSLAAALNGLAELERAARQCGRAAALYEEALSLSRALGASEFVGVILTNQSSAAVMSGDADRALALLREATQVLTTVGAARPMLAAIDVASMIACSLGEWSRVAKLRGACEVQLARLGLAMDPYDKELLTEVERRAEHALGEAGYLEAKRSGKRQALGEIFAETTLWVVAASRSLTDRSPLIPHHGPLRRYEGE